MSETENKINISSKIKTLDEKIKWFYGEDFNLDEALKNYKSSLELAKEIENDLQNLKNEVEILSEDFSVEKS